MRDEFWALRDDVPDDDLPVAEIPVAELTDLEGARSVGRAPGSRRVAALLLVAALVAAGVVAAAHVSGDASGDRRKVASVKPRDVTTIDDARARVDVLAALNATTASGSFRIHFALQAVPGAPTPPTTDACLPIIPARTAMNGTVPESNTGSGCGYASAGPANVAITGDGVVHVAPTALVTMANVPTLGEITTRVDGTNVWEDGGANYGMAPSASTGPGSPLSQFAGLVLSTLGRREGAVAMNSMASPTGYLDFAKQAITGTSKLGDAAVDGVPVKEYAVTIDSMRALDRPGLTAEEVTATTAALAVLRQEGYASTSVRLSIDGLGFIRRAHTVVRFADGGTVTGETTFSDFGCASVLMLANGPSIAADPDGCRAPAVAASPSSSPAGTGTP